MVKVTFPAYVLAPALFLTLTPWPEAKPRLGRLLATWALIAGVSVGSAAWLWYADNWRSILGFVRNAAYGPAAASYAVSVSAFAASTLVHAASPWTVVSLVVLLLYSAAGRRLAGTRRPLLLSLSWLAPPVVMVLSSSNRYGRYLTAALPALALAVAALAEPWLRRSNRSAAMAVTILSGPPLAYFLVATLPTPIVEGVRTFVEERTIGGNQYETPIDPRPWPNAAIVQAAARVAGGGPPAVLRLNVDLPEMNHNNLEVEALLQRVELVPAPIDQGSPEGAVATALDGDFLLLQTGGPVAVDFLNVQRAVVAGALATGAQPYREEGSFEVPGGRRVTLLARSCVVEDQPGRGPPLATLERGLELVSVEAARSTAGLVSVRTRYRARNGTHPMLAVRVELVDPNGRALGAGEHLLCRRPPRSWRAGTVVEDTFLLRSEAAAPGILLRLGLRDLLTGAPLRVDRMAAGIGSTDGTALVIPRWSEGLSPPSGR